MICMFVPHITFCLRTITRAYTSAIFLLLTHSSRGQTQYTMGGGVSRCTSHFSINVIHVISILHGFNLAESSKMQFITCYHVNFDRKVSLARYMLLLWARPSDLRFARLPPTLVDYQNYRREMLNQEGRIGQLHSCSACQTLFSRWPMDWIPRGDSSSKTSKVASNASVDLCKHI